jgi:c-di-GMP-binding flagellar brake protein YcgR
MATGQTSSDMVNAPADSTPRLKNHQPSRRLTWRITSPSNLWVYWNSKKHGDLSRVYDLSIGGLLVETPQAIPIGETIELDFLVQEGQIRAQAVVRYVKHGFGLGLKFAAIRPEDRPHLAALLTRIRAASQRRNQSKQSD